MKNPRATGAVRMSNDVGVTRSSLHVRPPSVERVNQVSVSSAGVAGSLLRKS